ncbi:MAG: hypothetical protein B7Y83_02410 [Flavobacteriales bacterium 32-34-25]|nr:MAG: hypothetical protein B7Y83_02410 [Flavobacteriales bacterium 32-34-25]
MSTEIKPSFSLKYVLLILLTAGITAVVTIGIQEFQKEEKIKKIALNVKGGNNEINFAKAIDNAIDIKYSLKNDTAEVKGYYHKFISLSNIGNVGLENLKCKISSKDSSIIILPNPKFESYPKEIGQLDFNFRKISNFKNEVEISLLNINEGVNIIYEAYSKKPIKSFDIDVAIRQKDLEVVRIDNIVVNQENDSIFKIAIYVTIGILLIMVVITILLLFSWKENAKIREKYNGNFWAYWWRGY